MSNGKFFFMGEQEDPEMDTHVARGVRVYDGTEKPPEPVAEWRAEYPGQAHLFPPGWARSACGRKTPKGTVLSGDAKKCAACEKSEGMK